tara:strand:- start:2411 stop:3709 length:1299 start_codon:yes stop_codon:yes gene_type:complete
MGALAGHLSHLQENLDFTFGELKSILSSIVSGDTPVVEKVDGQNIFFSFSVDPTTGAVRTARNKGDLAKGGMTPDEFSSKWEGHPAQDAFMNGFNAIEAGLSGIGGSTLKTIFTPQNEGGKRFINAEIVYTGNPNVINYGGDYIVMHNLQEFDEAGKLTDIQLQGGDFASLVSAVESAQQDADAKGWAVIGPQVVELQDLSMSDILESVNAGIDSLGISDSMTLGDFVAEKLRIGKVGNLPISVNKQEDLIRRIIEIGQGVESKDLPPLADIKKGLPKDVQKQISSMATQANAMKVIGAILAPVELVIHNLAVEVLRGLSSALSGGHDEEISRLKSELDTAVEKINSAKDSKSDARREMLKKQLDKLGSSKNISSSMEGIVFEHPPGSKSLYKLTGAFAPLNQIIGASYRIPKVQNESLLRNYVREFMGGLM